ncbi:MAG: 50S ribosomal protein L25/general stress protein Ctc [Bacteroidales bacterium]
MKTVKLSGSLRENVGKKDAKSQRKEGRVPCVLYGGKEQVHFSTEEKQFIPIVFTPEVMFVEIDLGEKSFKAILQDIQYHPVSDKILHADFLELHDDREIKLDIPVHTTGTAKGVLRGGKLVQRLRKLPVKALPGFMPENITLDVTNLNIGHAIKVKDISIPDVTIMSNPYNTIVNVKTARGVVAADEEEAEVAGTEAPEAEE